MGSAGREQLEPGGVGPFHQFRLLVESVRFFRVACCLPPLVEPLFGGRQSDGMYEQMLMKPQCREHWQTNGTSGLLSCQLA